VHDRIAPGAVEGLYRVGSLALAHDRATVVAMVAAMGTMIAAMV
jgi:hypothetical protein